MRTFDDVRTKTKEEGSCYEKAAGTIDGVFADIPAGDPGVCRGNRGNPGRNGSGGGGNRGSRDGCPHHRAACPGNGCAGGNLRTHGTPADHRGYGGHGFHGGDHCGHRTHRGNRRAYPRPLRRGRERDRLRHLRCSGGESDLGSHRGWYSDHLWQREDEGLQHVFCGPLVHQADENSFRCRRRWGDEHRRLCLLCLLEAGLRHPARGHEVDWKL